MHKNNFDTDYIQYSAYYIYKTQCSLFSQIQSLSLFPSAVTKYLVQPLFLCALISYGSHKALTPYVPSTMSLYPSPQIQQAHPQTKPSKKASRLSIDTLLSFQLHNISQNHSQLYNKTLMAAFSSTLFIYSRVHRSNCAL